MRYSYFCSSKRSVWQYKWHFDLFFWTLHSINMTEFVLWVCVHGSSTASILSKKLPPRVQILYFYLLTFGARTCPCMCTPTHVMCSTVRTGRSLFHSPQNTEVCSTGEYWGNRPLGLHINFDLPLDLKEPQCSMNAEDRKSVV